MSNLKEGQKVFDYILQEWLTVTRIHTSFKKYTVEMDNSRGYTLDGKYYESDKLPRLSLTQWNPITGEGKYTPIDQEPPVQEGDMVWGYDGEGKTAMYGELTGVRNCHEYPYIISFSNCWRNVSKKRPHWIP